MDIAERFSAAVYDPFLWLGEKRGMAARRRELLTGARGRVLEIGAGTGLNLAHYPGGLDELVLAEPVEGMARKLEKRVRQEGAAARVVRAPAEALPFPDDSFDTIVSTMVLCTVEDLDASVREIERLLKPGGQFLFIEHLRSDDERWARWQDRLEKPWAAFADGCRCNRRTLDHLGEGKLRVGAVERDKWQGMPRVVRPLAIGAAKPAAGGGAG